MKRSYFIVVLAHSVHGRIQRLRVPNYCVYVALWAAVFAAIAGAGFVSSYGRMLWKIGDYNELRAENEALQKRYEELRAEVNERNVQLASLGNLATEVSIAYGIKRQFDLGEGEFSDADAYTPQYRNSLNQFDFLRQVQISSIGDASPWFWLEDTTPSIWPVQARVSSSFGRRLDPFLGKGAFHPGVDLNASRNSSVVATADGIVSGSGWAGRYGKLVILRHGGNGLTTRYAHLNESFVRPGQVLRRGEVLGRVGSTGRSTSPHLHYEVRYRGTPVNPYKYLRRSKPVSTVFSLAD